MKRIFFLILILSLSFLLYTDTIITRDNQKYDCEIKYYENGYLRFFSNGKIYKIKIEDVNSFDVIKVNDIVSPEEKEKSLESPSIEKQIKEEKAYDKIDYNYRELLQILYDLEGKNILDDGIYTDLQKEKIWTTKYKGKVAEGKGTVRDVEKSRDGDISVEVKIDDCHNMKLYLKMSENDKAIKLNKGEYISFVGVLDKLGTGIMISHTMRNVILK